MKTSIQTAKTGLFLMAISIFASGCIIDLTGSGDDVDNTQFKVEETFDFKLATDGVNKFKVDGVNGVINITSSANLDSISISGLRRVGSESEADAQEYFSRLEVKVEKSGDEIEVKTIQPENTRGRQYLVNYTISLPDHLELDIENVNGEIILTSHKNEVEVDNVNGSIQLNGIEGDVEADLVNGNITCVITSAAVAKIEMAAVNGNLDLTVPRDISAAFSAELTNGAISTNNLELSNINSTRRSLSGTLGSGSGNISLNTVNGNITANGF